MSDRRSDARTAAPWAGGTPAGVRRRPIASALAMAAAVALSATLGACGDDAGATAGLSDGVLEVTLSDFSFGELPDEVPAGTRIEVENTSGVELHELVAFRLAHGDDRPLDDVVGPGLEELLTSGPPAAVLLAAPGGGEPVVAVGDGTLGEPGRYVLICAIPTGVDPDEYLAAAAESTDGPPHIEGAGAPHVTHGMYAELEVTGG